jgi:hypothetical protein
MNIELKLRMAKELMQMVAKFGVDIDEEKE